MAFAENLKRLPGVENIEKLELIDPDGKVVATIENKPGQTGSLAVYHHLFRRHGMINASAAMEGLTLYAEHATDARNNPFPLLALYACAVLAPLAASAILYPHDSGFTHELAVGTGLLAWSSSPTDIPATLQLFALMLQVSHLRSGVIAWGLLLALVRIAIAHNRLPVGDEASRASHAVVAGQNRVSAGRQPRSGQGHSRNRPRAGAGPDAEIRCRAIRLA